MEYVCIECKNEIENLDEGISCLQCGGRMIRKKRSGVAREVKTD